MDALEIQFGTTKGNRAGDRTEIRLLYANPFKIHICPLFALAFYLIQVGHMYQSISDNLFTDTDPAEAFRTALAKALKDEGTKCFVP